MVAEGSRVLAAGEFRCDNKDVGLDFRSGHVGEYRLDLVVDEPMVVFEEVVGNVVDEHHLGEMFAEDGVISDLSVPFGMK